MKSRSLFLFLALVIGGLTLGLRTTRERAEQLLPGGPFRFGVMAPLTGDFANYGRLIQDGVEMARADLKAQGIEAQIIFEDACLPAQGVTAAKKLLESDRIEALVSNYCLIALAAVQPLFDAKRVPLFQTDVVPDGVLKEGGFVLTTNSLIRPEAERLAELAFNKHRARRAAVLYLTTQWGEGFKEAFASRFKFLGGEIVAEETNPIGINDFRSELARVKASKPDVIFFAHLGTTLGNALKQARQLGLDQQILAADSAEEQGVLDIAGGAAEGLEFLSPDVVERSAVAESFSERFRRRFGYEPGVLTRNAYDATILAANSLKQCNRDSDCAQRVLTSTTNYQGASGTFSIKGTGETERAFVRKKVSEGRFIKSEG